LKSPIGSGFVAAVIRALIVLLAACGGSSKEPPSSVEPDSSTMPPDPDAAMVTCAGKEMQPRDQTWTLTVGNLSRTAKVHVPASYDPTKPMPLVVNIHGRTSNATSQLQLSHAIAKSDSAGFIVIHPEAWGTPTSWNAGTCCDPARASNIDDIGFMKKILDEAEAKLCIDLDRVYAMGLSNGGYMSHRMACELSDRVAAIGPVASNLLYQGCAPSRPVPVWMAHGTGDLIVSYSFVGPTVDFWVAKNGCTTMSTTFTNGDTSCVTHSGCTAGADVVLCTVQDGGHQWPGGDELPFLGKKTDAIVATDAIWDFFVAHPRK
jgi:polyhydroxybutyrate depolymerase